MTEDGKISFTDVIDKNIIISVEIALSHEPMWISSHWLFCGVGNGKMEIKQKVKEAIAYIIKAAKTLYGTLFKWIILSVVIGI